MRFNRHCALTLWGPGGPKSNKAKGARTPAAMRSITHCVGMCRRQHMPPQPCRATGTGHRGQLKIHPTTGMPPCIRPRCRGRPQYAAAPPAKLRCKEQKQGQTLPLTMRRMLMGSEPATPHPHDHCAQPLLARVHAAGPPEAPLPTLKTRGNGTPPVPRAAPILASLIPPGATKTTQNATRERLAAKRAATPRCGLMPSGLETASKSGSPSLWCPCAHRSTLPPIGHPCCRWALLWGSGLPQADPAC
jgi:hypothetical protein